MALPKAVASSRKTPGIYILVNLAAGPNNSGLAALRALMIGFKSSTGDIAADTEVRTVYGPEDVATALGARNPGTLAATQMFEAYGSLPLDIAAATAPTGAVASGTYEIAGVPTSVCSFVFDVAGREIGPVVWDVGETLSTFRLRAIGFLNAEIQPTTASVGADPEDIDLDADVEGTWGNDITFGVKRISGAGASITTTGSATKLANGAGEINITTILGLVDTQEYAAIGLVTGNTDATLNTTSSNAERLMVHIEGNASGGNALLQYGFVGHTASIANVKNGAIGRNSKPMSYSYLQNGQSLPAEVMGWDLGDAIRWYTQRANYNRIGNPAAGLVGGKDKNADKLRANEVEDLLNNGVSVLDFAQGTTDVVLIDAITTFSFTGAAPDFRCFYQSDVFGQYAFARDVRVKLPIEFAHCSITEDLPPDGDPLPPLVVERRDVEAFVHDIGRSWADAGVLNRTYLDEAIANNTFAIEIDEADTSQVNIFIPDKIVKPLAKFSVVFNKLG